VTTLLLEEGCLRATAPPPIVVDDQAGVTGDLCDPNWYGGASDTSSCIVYKTDLEQTPPEKDTWIGSSTAPEHGMPPWIVRIRHGWKSDLHRPRQFPTLRTWRARSAAISPVRLTATAPPNLICLSPGAHSESHQPATASAPIGLVRTVEEAGTAARFHKILETWKGRLFTGLMDRLAKQLSYLLGDEEDLAELLRAPDVKSFENFLSYCADRPWVKAPSLTLTRNGNFVANWRPAPHVKARVSIEFMADRRVRWSAADAENTGSLPTIIGGVCSISELDEHLGHYREWTHL
jgi:hypothetical protein